MMRATGVDVSHWKPVNNWAAVKNSGVSFIGIKATEGNSIVDPMLVRHRDQFRQQNFLLGAYYHFARSGSARDQAKRFTDAVGPLAENERLVLDLEVSPSVTAVENLKWVDDFFTEIYGDVCGDRTHLIYTSSRIWDEYIGGLAWDLASEVDLWAPRYNGTSEPRLPKPWKTWTFWQWTDGGETGPIHSTPGIGNCDASFYRGDEMDLAAYAKLRK